MTFQGKKHLKWKTGGKKKIVNCLHEVEFPRRNKAKESLTDVFWNAF